MKYRTLISLLRDSDSWHLKDKDTPFTAVVHKDNYYYYEGTNCIILRNQARDIIWQGGVFNWFPIMLLAMLNTRRVRRKEKEVSKHVS